MIQQLNPLENFPIVRQLEDPTDNATYYVQATIYDGKNNALLATVNLASQGGQLYTAVWQVVADSSGMGRYIYMTIKVYTDAAYTTLSAKYGIVNDTFLVQGRVNAALVGGGQYDWTIFDKKTRTILAEVIPGMIPKQEKITIPEQETIDLSGIHDAISASAKEIKAHFKQDKMPDFEKIIRAAVNEMAESSLSLHNATRKEISAIAGTITSEVKRRVAEIRSELIQEIIADQRAFEDKIMQSVQELIEDNLGKSQIQVVYQKREDGKKKESTREFLRRIRAKPKV